MPRKLNFAALASTLAHHLKVNPNNSDSLRIVTKGIEEEAFHEAIQVNLQHFLDLTHVSWFDYSSVLKGDINAPLIVMMSWLKVEGDDNAYSYMEENENFFVEASLRKSILSNNIDYFSNQCEGSKLVVQDMSGRLFFAEHGSETLRNFSQDKKKPKGGIFSYLGVSLDKYDLKNGLSGKCYEFKIQRDGVLSLSLVNQMLSEVLEDKGLSTLSSYQIWIDSSLGLGQWLIVDRCLNFGAREGLLRLPGAFFSYDPCISFFQFLSSEHQPKVYININWDIGYSQLLVID